MDKASSHTSKLAAAYLANELLISNTLLCIRFVKTSLRKTASKNTERILENGSRGMETREFVDHTIVRVGRYLSHNSYKRV
ncbi:hypothetical protein TNCV_1690461 [Trichonephila clavipes]|nr:hypothetical protein TNCV_1690461 [Trichonephila clavipes]